MAGLRKAKKYDWKDSNLALFGSDTDKKVKKESAETEKAWRKTGKKVGLQIWRIEKFKVVEWPKEEYGQFYEGDSYIILNTYTEEGCDELNYDLHFWIGKYSTQDEYGTAAYKTVELDTYLDDVPIQHREVQGHESELFKSYFKSITLLKGGVETGFRQVKDQVYTVRLLHFCGTRKQIEIKEVAKTKDLDSGDVYILDTGLLIYQWNGTESNKDERFKAMQYLNEIKDDRAGKARSEVLEEESLDSEHHFYTFLTDEKDDDSDELDEPDSGEHELHRLSDSSGSIAFNMEKKGEIKITDLDSKDVFIIDTNKMLFVWIGKGSSLSEKQNAMGYAHKYLQKTVHPLISVTCLKEGQNRGQLELAFAA